MSTITIEKLFENYKDSPFEVLKEFCQQRLIFHIRTREIISFLQFRYEDAIQDLIILMKSNNLEALKPVNKLVEALKLTLMRLYSHLNDYDGLFRWSNTSNPKLRQEIARLLPVDFEHLLLIIQVMRPHSSNALPMSIDLSA